LHELLKSKKTSAVEIAESVFKRIEQIEGTIGAYVTLTKEIALGAAKAADEKIKRGEKISSLEGIPIAIKDNMCTKGIETTASSKILKNYKPPYNATVVEILNSMGAPMTGKTNLDEFAMGSSTENSAIKITKNPWDTQRVPGGSSGGAAAAVAANETILALGSDTGGSIRQPASFCGVVGL
jgi:aspartyl-tRNA(Asn)/glutamyl-tRNA(Gln) amidotransferase subunit A